MALNIFVFPSRILLGCLCNSGREKGCQGIKRLTGISPNFYRKVMGRVVSLKGRYGGKYKRERLALITGIPFLTRFYRDQLDRSDEFGASLWLTMRQEEIIANLRRGQRLGYFREKGIDEEREKVEILWLGLSSAMVDSRPLFLRWAGISTPQRDVDSWYSPSRFPLFLSSPRFSLVDFYLDPQSPAEI